MELIRLRPTTAGRAWRRRRCNCCGRCNERNSHSNGRNASSQAARGAGVDLFGGPKAAAALGLPPAESLRHEYGSLAMAVEIVDDVDGAIAHVNAHGSGHTDVCVSEDAAVAEEFMRRVDSADVFHNCSSRFADGFRFGLGAEVRLVCYICCICYIGYICYTRLVCYIRLVCHLCYICYICYICCICYTRLVCYICYICYVFHIYYFCYICHICYFCHICYICCIRYIRYIRCALGMAGRFSRSRVTASTPTHVTCRDAGPPAPARDDYPSPTRDRNRSFTEVSPKFHRPIPYPSRY